VRELFDYVPGFMAIPADPQYVFTVANTVSMETEARRPAR
jgi:hypothetical protein